MAQLISVKLSRFDGSPWGFRLQGGKDFGTPLIVQKVNNGSPAEAAGLRAGDSVIKVNNTDVFSLRHKDAQDVIVRAGNNFEMTVQRGGGTWRPSVSPVTASIPSPQPTAPIGNISPVTKTSLAAKKQDVHLIGSGHNFSPKPFLNGSSDGTVKSIVNKQYNSPVGIYSEETIAETLSAQAEVLAGGVLGVNFKKNEKNYNAQNSEVFKMVQEADKEPRTPEPAEPPTNSGIVTPTSPALAGLRSVQAPETKPPSTPQAGLPPGQNICAECERLIVGVFVRIKEKNLHVECFKCSTCGTSLKNVGYYNINNKLYCDIHAKLVARQNAPAGLVPVTVGPGQKAPANTISAALSNIGPLSPSLSNHGSSSPQPFSSYSPEIRQCQYKNGLNGLNGSGHTNGSDYCESKTYTSTLTIQTNGSGLDGNENDDFGYSLSQQQPQQQQPELDYNRNPTNEYFNNIDNKLHKLTDEIRDFAFDQQKQSYALDEQDYCAKNFQAPKFVRAFKPTRLGSSPFDQPSFRPVQAPTTNNIGGPKPFIGSSITNQTYSSSPIINTGSSTLPRPQNQSVTETTSYHAECRDQRHSGPRPQSYHEERCTYELVKEVCRPKATEKPPTPKVKPSWPPVKAIEDITYPTASPLYIDPNPTLDKRHRQVTRERRATIESVISREHSRRSSYTEQQYHNSEMDQISCPGPVYRRVELVNARESRQTRCERSSSRASSTDSVRRSLTPTRITQPIPRPWTATVTSGTNLYQSAYAPQPDQICRNYCEKEVCQREKVCQREQSTERQVCQRTSKRESSCERQPPPGHHHHEQHTHRVEDTCKTEGNVHRHEHTTSQVCKFVCEPGPEPEPEPEVQQEEMVDLSKIVPPDVAICPKGVDAEHDLYTETEEEDKGNLHIKKTTTYEKTVELVSPDRVMGPPFGQQEEEKSEITREEYTQRSSTVDREVEDISGRRHVTETSESISKKIDTQKLMEETRKQEEEERKRRQEEERRQRQEEERKRQEEEQLYAEMKQREEESRRQKEEAERQRKEEERRRVDEEQAERSKVCCSEQRTEVIEECRYQAPRERIIDVQVEQQQSCKCSNERIIDVQVEDRPPSRERIIEIKMEEDPPCKRQVKEVKEEVCIKQHCEHQDYEEQRKRSLREQVEVHQNLREQQSPCKRQPTLQERRLCSRLSKQQGQQQSTCTKKHVQFVKQTDNGPCPLPQTPVKNSTPKEWQSEMCKALTTASDRKYSPLQSGLGNQSSCGDTKEVYRSEVRYEQNTVCCKCQPPNRPVSPFVQALTTASDRPYSPLGREVNPNAFCTCKCRSETPEMMNTYEGYSAPSQILYRGKPKEPPKKPDGPRPLPTPPPDFKFRNRSVSPACRSRSQTPSGRVSACGLKRPDTIPSYQKYLVCEEQEPVQGQDFPPSRTPTPACCKSPAPGPPEPPACYARAQAPRIRDDPPPCKRNERDTTTPDKSEIVRYHYEEDTPKGHKSKDTVSQKTVSWVGQGASKHAHFQEHDDTVTEECDGSHHVKKMEHRLKEYDEPEPPAESPIEDDTCYISQNTHCEVTLPCPAVQNNVMDRIQKTGVRVFAPTGTPEVRRIRHEIPPPAPKPPCPMTGVTVLPIKAHGETSCKTGVVVVPCDGIGTGGVCITPTPDRSGVSVSPCPAQSGGICKKPSCYCGSTSGNCTTNLGNEKTTCSIDAGTCTGSGICVKQQSDGSCTVGPCTMTGIPGVRSVQCPRPAPKCLGAAKANLPFPQIPLPEEETEENSCQNCPLASSSVNTTTTSFSSTSESRDCGFQPIHKPQTNLCNQITTLTLCKRETKPAAAPAPPIPTVQLYKPQPAPPPAPPCRTSSSQVKTQTIQSQKRFREIQTTSQTQSRTQCQTQTSCLTSNTQSSVDPPNMSSHPNLGAGGFGGNKSGTFAGSSAPNRGRGILNQAGSGLRVPLCAACNSQVRLNNIVRNMTGSKESLRSHVYRSQFTCGLGHSLLSRPRGPFISALGQIWCPDHFVCVNPQCRRGLQDIGFVEEKGQLYCEYCFEKFIAPSCNKCNNKIKGDCLNAIGKHFHPECFNCAHCGKYFGNNPFFLEEGLPYCERDWNDLFTTKCFACGFPVEAGDRWVEALSNNYHSQCFNCTMCKKNLEGQSFYAKGGRPFCKNHAR